MMLLKLYPLLVHQISGIFFGGGILLSIAAHFKAKWANQYLDLNPHWKKWAVAWCISFVPLIFLTSHIYPWKDFHGSKAIYFHSAFVIIRMVFYIAGSFLALAALKKLPSLSLVLFFFIGSFFAIDWGMSLEPKWFSNLYSFHYLANASLGSFAIFIYQRSDKLSPEAIIDSAHILLTLSMVGLYLHYAQYIILWMANHPSEVSWYLSRDTIPMNVINVVMHVLKFVPIFFICFKKKWKTDPDLLKKVALGVLIGYVLEMIWFIGPSLYRGGQ